MKLSLSLLRAQSTFRPRAASEIQALAQRKLDQRRRSAVASHEADLRASAQAQPPASAPPRVRQF